MNIAMMGSKSGRWDKSFVVALLGLIVAVAALVVAVTTPELRKCLGLEQEKPKPSPARLTQHKVGAPRESAVPEPQPTTPQSVEPRLPSIIPADLGRPATATMPPRTSPQLPQSTQKPAEPTAPDSVTSFACLLHEKQPRFVEQAQVTLSVSFQHVSGEQFVSLVIAPVGRKSSVHAVLEGYSHEFVSSAGRFLVDVASIDWSSRTVNVQVSRKSS